VHLARVAGRQFREALAVQGLAQLLGDGAPGNLDHPVAVASGHQVRAHRLEVVVKRLDEDGLGAGDPREIEIVGDVDAAQENWHFHVGKNLVRIGGGDLIWFGPLKRFQKLFFHTPLVNGFILASDVYHDFYRWPLIDRRVFERWCETTEWGQMFLRYAQMGPQGRPPDAMASPRRPTAPMSSRIH